MSKRSRYQLLRMLFITLGVLALIGVVYAPTEYLPLAKKSDPNWLLLISGMAGLYVIRPFLLWPLSVFSVFIGYVFGFPEGIPFILIKTLLHVHRRSFWPLELTTITRTLYKLQRGGTA